MRSRRFNAKGFTLVELMIALSILSTILIMSTVILTQIGKWYSKGVNAANLQNASRTIMADMTSVLQFNGGGFRPGVPISDGGDTVYAWCINNVRYSYVVNRELGNDQGSSPAVITNHVLWRDTMKTAANCNPLHILSASGAPSDIDSLNPSDGFEMVGNHMRLAKLDITADGSLYTVTVNMGFGDSDLVVITNGKAACNGGPGTEYCSATNLTTTVKKRIE